MPGRPACRRPVGRACIDDKEPAADMRSGSHNMEHSCNGPRAGD